MSLRPAWATGDSFSKQNKTKQNEQQQQQQKSHTESHRYKQTPCQEQVRKINVLYSQTQQLLEVSNGYTILKSVMGV